MGLGGVAAVFPGQRVLGRAARRGRAAPLWHAAPATGRWPRRTRTACGSRRVSLPCRGARGCGRGRQRLSLAHSVGRYGRLPARRRWLRPRVQLRAFEGGASALRFDRFAGTSRTPTASSTAPPRTAPAAALRGAPGCPARRWRRDWCGVRPRWETRGGGPSGHGRVQARGRRGGRSRAPGLPDRGPGRWRAVPLRPPNAGPTCPRGGSTSPGWTVADGSPGRVPDPLARRQSTRRQVPGYRVFERGRIWLDGSTLYVATTADHRVHAYDTRRERIEVIYDGLASRSAPLLGSTSSRARVGRGLRLRGPGHR